MKRLIPSSTVLILLLCLAGCRPAAAPTTPPPSAVTPRPTSTRTATATVTPTPPPILARTLTFTPLPTSEQILSSTSASTVSPFVYHAILRDYLHEYIQYGAPIDDELVFGRGTAFADWIANWLAVFQKGDVPQELRLKDFRVQPVMNVGTAEGSGSSTWVVINVIDLNPVAGYASLWREYDQALDDQGWMVDQRLGFVFEKHDGRFELIDILLHSPQVFDKAYEASEFDQLSREQFVYEATSRWLESYLSEGILEDYQIADFSITDVTMTETSDSKTEWEVVFSVRESTVPPRYGGLPSLRWRRSPFGGYRVLESHWIKDLMLRATVWQDQERIYFSTLSARE